MKEIKILNASIAIFNQKLNNIHFNYSGKEFRSVHKLTEKLYKEGLVLYDDLSEKIVMHGEIVEASFKEYLELTIIKELKGQKLNLEKVVETIVNDSTKLIAQADKVEGTNVIQPLLDEIYMIYDKYRWLFRSLI